MNAAECTQTRTDCTMADLEAWCAAVEVYAGEHDGAGHVIRIDRTYPPCIGCGGSVFDTGNNALLIKSQGKSITSITFGPCGCVLSVADGSDGELS